MMLLLLFFSQNKFFLQVSATGTTLRNEINGVVQLRTMLTGMPELRLGLNDKILFEHTGRKLFSFLTVSYSFTRSITLCPGNAFKIKSGSTKLKSKKCNLTLAVSPTCPQHMSFAYVLAPFYYKSVVNWQRILRLQ